MAHVGPRVTCADKNVALFVDLAEVRMTTFCICPRRSRDSCAKGRPAGLVSPKDPVGVGKEAGGEEHV